MGIVADYSYSIKEGYSPLTVDFTENCIGSPTYFKWHFGDGESIENQSDPQHIYKKAGVYSPVLEIRRNDESDVMVKYNIIIVNTTQAESENTIIESYQNDGSDDWKFYIDENLFLVFNIGGEIFKSSTPAISEGVWTLVEFHVGRNQFYVSTLNEGRKKIPTYNISLGLTGTHSTNKLVVTPNSSMKIDELRAVRRDEDLGNYFRSLKSAVFYLH